jgi:hypothetical protein
VHEGDIGLGVLCVTLAITTTRSRPIALGTPFYAPKRLLLLNNKQWSRHLPSSHKCTNVGLTRDFQTVGYVHVGNEVLIRAGAH